VSALRAGKSLLPAGVIRVDGQFARGDAVVVRGPDTHEIGRGPSPPTTPRTPTGSRAARSPDVMVILGVSGRAEMIHRDDLVVGPRQAEPGLMLPRGAASQTQVATLQISAQLGHWPSRQTDRS